MHAQAKGKAVINPMTNGYKITFGTFLPGFGISSHRCAPASLPKKAYTALLTLSRKENPLFVHPVPLEVSVKTQDADAWESRLQMNSVIVVAERVNIDRTTAACK
jgi:hypothetical protein